MDIEHVLKGLGPFKLESLAFVNGGEIPEKYTCEGENISPPLSWRSIHPETKSLALIVDDPDAPDPKKPQRTWVHWVLYNIPVEINSLEEGILQLPTGIQTGANDWKKINYGGPCPPIGRHRYFHKLYALDMKLKDLGEPTKSDLEKAMKGHVLEKTELIGTYEKKKF